MKTPKYDERTVLCGSTGSGKTALGLWHLSIRNFLNRTIVIINHKSDKDINKINCKKLKLGASVPDDNGFYIVNPISERMSSKQSILVDEKLTDMFWDIWEQGNCLLYVDEVMMLNKHCPAFKALLTQGRSRNIELILLTQRPVEVSRFIFSECDYLGLMRLNDIRDLETVEKAVGVKFRADLPEFHSFWLDRRVNHVITLAPVPLSRDSVRNINLKINGEVKEI